MKTRQEMIYDFMLALASNPSVIDEDDSIQDASEWVYMLANSLANEYLENL
jgi:hypothetical protein